MMCKVVLVVGLVCWFVGCLLGVSFIIVLIGDIVKVVEVKLGFGFEYIVIDVIFRVIDFGFFFVCKLFDGLSFDLVNCV